MKIGILTLPLHTNYGGILQAYALQTVLERMGHETRHIIVKPNMKYGVLHKVKRTLAPIKRVVKLALIPDKLTSDIARHTSYFISRNVKLICIDASRMFLKISMMPLLLGVTRYGEKCMWKCVHLSKYSLHS